MDPIILRVAARYHKAKTPVDIRTLEITADNVEQVLTDLTNDLDSVDEIEKSLGLDLQSLTHLMRQYPHNDDIHHNGEDVLQHTKWVLQDLAELTQGMDSERKTILTLSALLHDLGKAYTYAFIDGQHTFRKHALKSVQIAEALLAKHRESLGSLYPRILDLIRLHDTFMVLINAKAKASGFHYLNKIMRESIYLDGHLDDLLTLSKADSRRAKRYESSLADAELVLQDIAEVERKRQEESQAKERRQQAVLDHLPEIQMILTEVPEAVAALPNLSDVNAALGAAKRYDLLKKLKEITK